MTFWPCGVFNGLMHSGCLVSVCEEGIEITLLVFTIYKLTYAQIVKNIKFNNKKNMFKVEFNTGTRKNEIFDFRTPFNGKAFIKQVEDLGWTIEARERYKREISY